VWPAGLLVAAVTLGVGLLRHSPLAMAVLIATVAFVTLMAMAWGPRAGPLSFSGTLAMVFAMASDAPATPTQAWQHAGWVLLGALLYGGWALATSWALRRRYRELAVAAAMRAVAVRLRSRAVRVAGTVSEAEAGIRASIRDDALLAEALQAARDQVFAARFSQANAGPLPSLLDPLGGPGAKRQVRGRQEHSRRLIAVVLKLIDLRDLLMASRLDLGLLGDDATARAWRGALAHSYEPLAQALDDLADHVALGQPLPALTARWADAWRADLETRLAAVPGTADDPRRTLVETMQGRLAHVLDDVVAMRERLLGAPEPAASRQALQAAPSQWLGSSPGMNCPLDSSCPGSAPRGGQANLGAALRLLEGPDAPFPWTREQLQLFVSPEGWPLAALKPHLSLQSPVMRHALRGALAMGSAWGLGLALPWASHPHWLVLSVAVVLRGNLEQTLSRRNERVIGTVIGCLLVLALARPALHGLLPWVFLAAVGTAHAYVNVRYRVAATAATLMALLQPLLLMPGTGPAVGERLADTVLGALLAWAFCFVLPSWERRGLMRLAKQLATVLNRHAGNVLVWAPTAEQQLAQRLSRQQAYQVLGALAAAAQRNAVEPQQVRVPEERLEALLASGYRWMALLGTLQQTLARRADVLDAAQCQPALQATAKACTLAAARALLGHPVQPHAEPPEAAGSDWPEQGSDLTPWVLRRLRLCEEEAGRLADAVQALNAPVRV
jgi:uncharacterized membrane protein YccC